MTDKKTDDLDKIKELGEKLDKDWATDVTVEATNIYDYLTYIKRGYKDIQLTQRFFADICSRLQLLTQFLQKIDGMKVKKRGGGSFVLQIFEKGKQT